MGYCISVCIEKGGVGKTVTVCNLAALMARRMLTVDVHRVNTIRLQGDLKLKKDQLETELKNVEVEVAKRREA